MEATVFTGLTYDHLKPHAAALKVARPLMLRAISAAKKKNERIDANKICDCLRCDFLPECYIAPTDIRERRRTLRYRNLLVRQVVQRPVEECFRRADLQPGIFIASVFCLLPTSYSRCFRAPRTPTCKAPPDPPSAFA